MKKSRHPEIRALLRQYPDGLTRPEVAERIGMDITAASNALKVMPDTYIDRWVKCESNGKYMAVYCIIVPPADCPHPLEEK
jgi:hypothetical protein